MCYSILDKISFIVIHIDVQILYYTINISMHVFDALYSSYKLKYECRTVIYSDSIIVGYLLYYTIKLYKRNKEQQHPQHCISRCTRTQHWQTASATIIKGAHWRDNEPYFKVTTIQCDLIYNPISIIIDDDDDMCMCVHS